MNTAAEIRLRMNTALSQLDIIIESHRAVMNQLLLAVWARQRLSAKARRMSKRRQKIYLKRRYSCTRATN